MDCGRRDFTYDLEIMFLLLLTVPSVPPPKKNLNIAAPHRSRSSRVCATVEELQFDFCIELGLEEGEKLDVLGSEFLQSNRIANQLLLKKI